MDSWLEPLLDAETMRSVDSWAIDEQEVPSLELMETAGAAVAEAVESLRPDGPIRVVCGKGNNGGDGLVAARHLATSGFEVETFFPVVAMGNARFPRTSRVVAKVLGDLTYMAFAFRARAAR